MPEPPFLSSAEFYDCRPVRCGTMGAAPDFRFWRYVMVGFDVGKLEACLGADFNAKALENPRLRFEVTALIAQSQWHCCRALKATTGVSPYQWQLGAPLNLVLQHLMSSEMPLDLIAKITGFSGAVHLIRVFKKRTGKTPGAWRRKRKPLHQVFSQK